MSRTYLDAHRSPAPRTSRAISSRLGVVTRQPLSPFRGRAVAAAEVALSVTKTLRLLISRPRSRSGSRRASLAKVSRTPYDSRRCTCWRSSWSPRSGASPSSRSKTRWRSIRCSRSSRCGTPIATGALALRGRTARPDSRRPGLAAGAVLGLLLGLGIGLQTAGLERTTVSSTGFITGLYVVLTPLFGLVLFRTRLGPRGVARRHARSGRPRDAERRSTSALREATCWCWRRRARRRCRS